MRRMYSDGQVVKVVNKAIDDGEIVIEAGGLPKIESGDAGKVLAVNSSETGAEWIKAKEAKEVYPIAVPFSHTSNSSSFDLTAEQKAFINTNRPIIKLIFSDSWTALLNYDAAATGGITTSAVYLGLFDIFSAGNSNKFLNFEGYGLSYQKYRSVQVQIPPNNNNSLSASYSATEKIIYKEDPWTSAPAILTSVTVTDGGKISNSTLKNCISKKAVVNMNNALAYPITRSTSSPYISQYFSITESSGSLIITHYTINESTWVINFVTKTLS